MSLLSQVTTGVVERPYYILVHGIPGIGKSTFGADFPNPIFLCSEKGTSHLNVTRLELDTFDKFLVAIEELRSTKHDFKTLVVDTVDHLEQLIHQKVSSDEGKDSIEEIGYGKGYTYALAHWTHFITAVEKLRDEKGMDIVLLNHTEIKTVNDPQLTAPYDKYQPKLHNKAASLLVDRVEAVLFVNYKVLVKKDDGSSKGKAFGDGVRIVYTEHRPAYVAKNRYNLPLEMPLSFEDFNRLAKMEKSNDPFELKENIEVLIKEMKDENLKQKIKDKIKAAGNDSSVLIAIENRVKAIVAS